METAARPARAPKRVAARRVIFTADDFGRSPEINAAVARAHRDGLLTAASLMVGGSAAEDAVAVARANPDLAVGLHVVAVDGMAVLPPAEIPDIVDAAGRFAPDALRAGLRYSLSRAARRQIEAEIEAQFARFAATGLALSHVDGHQHMHLHPAILPAVLRLAQRHGARGLRVPHEPIAPALARGGQAGGVGRLVEAAALRLLARRARRRLRGTSLVVPKPVYGLLQSGAMHEAYVAQVLRTLTTPLAEIYFHPTTGPRLAARGPNPGDLETLLSPMLRGLVMEQGMMPVGYSYVPEPSAACSREGDS